MTTFPFGYEGRQLSWDQMMTQKTVHNLHPEMRRRFHALIEYAASCGVPLGVGGGWRIQPNPPPPGFAKPGNSWHESVPVNPPGPTALAIDTVPNASWPWMHDHCGAYGIRHFNNVNNEPWHVQPSEIPTGRKFSTTLPPLTIWKLPGTPPPPTTTGVFLVPNAYRQEVREGSKGKMAKMCQQQINLLSGAGLAEDGNFGKASVAALKNMQAYVGLGADGICGPKSWQAFEDGIKKQTEAGDWD